MFKLHDILKRDTFPVTSLKLCQVLLMNDSSYPWLILVPELDGLRDFHDVPQDRKADLLSDIDQASKALEDAYAPYKINVAALGNMVEQLHIHVIGRFQDDAAWPGPVWGQQPAVPYLENDRTAALNKLKESF